MPRDVAKYLHDIRAACDLIAEFTQGRTFEDYESDAMLRSAVERQFEIAGEALRNAVELEPSLLDKVSHARDIIAFRNRLIHGYSQVSNELVWGVVERDVATLRVEVGEAITRFE